MYILFTDETNTNSYSANVEFFAYSGLIIPIEKFVELDKGINNIRKQYGYCPADEFKFDTNSRPHQVKIEDTSAAKNEVVNLCISLECKFIAYVVLHAIANQDLKNKILWGANTVIGKFNYFLTERADYGIVAIDRLPNGSEYNFLSDKFTCGLNILYENKTIPLDQIKLFTSTCNNASHASSAMDIVLGSFRYCINQLLTQNSTAARTMMKNVAKLIWADGHGDKLYPFEKGLIFRPKEIEYLPYKEKYHNLHQHINSLLNNDNETQD